jgi:hypothetical protein
MSISTVKTKAARPSSPATTEKDSNGTDPNLVVGGYRGLSGATGLRLENDPFYEEGDNAAREPNLGRNDILDRGDGPVAARDHAGTGSRRLEPRPAAAGAWDRLKCCLARRAALRAGLITHFAFTALDAVDGHANNDTGECFVHMKTLAEDVRGTVDARGDCKGVRNALKRAEKVGLLLSKLKVHHPRPNEWRTSKSCWLTVPTASIDAPVADESKPITPDRNAHSGRASTSTCDAPTGTPIPNRTEPPFRHILPTDLTQETEREKEKESLRDSQKKVSRDAFDVTLFVRFWVQWPDWAIQPIERRQEAEKAFSAVCRDEDDLAIINAVRRYIEQTPPGQFRMSPVRFLNEESWIWGLTTATQRLSTQLLYEVRKGRQTHACRRDPRPSAAPHRFVGQTGSFLGLP